MIDIPTVEPKCKYCGDHHPNIEEWSKAHGFKLGDRVVLTESVERWDSFIVNAGAAGTITYLETWQLDIKMDEHIPGCEEWNNCVIFCYEDIYHDIDHYIHIKKEAQ